MDNEEQMYKFLIEELRNLSKEHGDIDIDNIPFVKLADHYQKLRYKISELVGVFGERKTPETDADDELLPLKTAIRLEQLRMDFKELLTAFALEHESPLPIREEHNFKFLLARYGLD